MQQVSTLTNAEWWDLPLAEPPTRSSPLREKALYLDGMVVDVGLYSNDDTGDYEWVEPSRAVARAICEAEDFHWPSIARELRTMQFARSASAPDGDLAVTPQGIQIRVSTLWKLTYGLAPLCPFRKSGISRAYRFWRWDDDCGSWACEKCGPDQADRLLRGLERILRVGGTNELYVVRVRYRPGLLNMMKKRNLRVRASYFWYRDVGDTVTFVSTKPLLAVNSTKEPRVWNRTSAEAALIELRDVLWIPGHRDHGFAGDWEGALDTPDPEPGGGSFDTRGLADEQMLRVLAIFKEEAQKDFGVDDDLGYIPPHHEQALEDLMEDIIKQVREESAGS